MKLNDLRRRIKILIGLSTEILFPRFAGSVESSDSPRYARFARRTVIYTRLQRGIQWRDSDRVEDAQVDYWRSNAYDAYYDDTAEQNERRFLDCHWEIVQVISKMCHAGKFSRLIEIGCGNGRVLTHLSTAMPSISELIGLDLNAKVIARNQQTYRSNSRLRFIRGDARSILSKILVDRCLLWTYGGVLEYLSKGSVERLFSEIANRTGSAIAIVEPVDAMHDLVFDQSSHVFGGEGTFSHSYPALLSAAGMRVTWQRELRVDGINWLMIVAVTST